MVAAILMPLKANPSVTKVLVGCEEDCEASNDRRAAQFDDDDVKFGTELKKHASKFGLDNIGNILKDNLKKWRKMPLNIAVTGASGKGKSSLINALRGLTELDPGSAKVGVKETTTAPTSYKYPGMEGFLIWDVPGVGTKKFPKERYIEDIKADRFDFFIIVIAERITEIDAWLFTELKRRNPLHRCYIVRTKVDNDLRNEERKLRKGEHFDKRKKFVQLKKEFLAEIKKAIPVYPDFNFFLISNHHVGKFDFPELEIQLLKDVPFEKRNTMLFGVIGISNEIVKEKAKALRSRVWKIAMLSGTGALIPIPYLSSGIDASLILNEIMFYRAQFGLYDESLRKIAKNVSLDKLKESLQLQTPFGQFTLSGITQLLSKYLVTKAVEKVAFYTMPVIGSIIASGMSYNLTNTVLNDLITSMENDTLKILNFLTEENFAQK